MAAKSGSPVGPASVRDAVPQRPLRRLSRGGCGSVRAGRGSSDVLPPWLRRPQKRARPVDDFPSLDDGDALRRHSVLVADHAIADSGRRRFLLHSDHEGRSWV